MSLAGDVTYLASLLARRRDRPYARRWWQSRHPYATVTRAVPWLVFEAIDALEGVDLAGKSVFEYGSGGSTLFWLKRGARCVSVEHDAQWYETLRKKIGDAHDLDYQLVPPLRSDVAREPDDPDGYRSSSDPHLDFRAYCQAIDRYDPFDVILVDGRARPSCIKHAAGKLAPGGLLIIDNADRDYYFARTAPLLSAMEMTEYRGPGPIVPERWATRFYRRRA